MLSKIKQLSVEVDDLEKYKKYFPNYNIWYFVKVIILRKRNGTCAFISLVYVLVRSKYWEIFASVSSLALGILFSGTSSHLKFSF